MIETIVDRLVIRDDDPREPHASRSGMKLRAMAVSITPALIVLAITTALEVPAPIAVGVPIAVMLAGVKTVARPINERIAELETAENGSE